MANINVKVDAQALKSSADLIQNKYKNCITTLNEIEKEVNALKNDWEGRKANAFQSEFAKTSKQCKEILEKFNNYPIKIGEEAGIYEATDKLNLEMASGIKTINNFMMD